METFVSIAMTHDELAQLETAAHRAGCDVQRYLLAAGLAAAAKSTPRRVIPPELVEAHRAMIGAYTQALGYAPTYPARVAKTAALLVKQGRRPEDLATVMAFVRQRDGRYRQGQHVPLEIVADAWGPWEKAQRVATTQAITPVNQSNVVLDEIFGEVEEW